MFIISVPRQTKFLVRTGTVLTAILQGFAGINLFFVNLFDPIFGIELLDEELGFNISRVPREKRVHNLKSILSMIAKEKYKMQKLLKKQQKEKGSSNRGFFMSFFKSSDDSEDLPTKIELCKAEINTMRKVQEEYYQDMMISYQIEERKRFMRTPLGQLFMWVGRAVAIFCMFKIFMTIRSVFFLDNANRNNSLGTKIKYAMTLLHISFSNDVYNELIIQFCTFCFVGIIIYININSLFNNLLVSLKNVLMSELKIKFSSSTTIIIF